ncbi:ricin-type beta-trefoil lectin domain protein [Kitasatospora sp. NPDC057541]|uniref:ricin-type beta-trefoil lectin domain protein n=1 Tax=unclassified Kitasatospora TaxID=2633591 RepID=UPI00367EDBC0
MRWKRAMSAAVTLGLLVQTGVAVEALAASSAFAAPAPETPQANAVAGTTAEAPDEASALLSARLQGRRVEVVSARTESTTLWANPEGTLTSDRSTGPVRMKSGGSWVAVDTTLAPTPTGKVAPKAHPGALVLEGGDPAVTVGDSLPGTDGAPAPGDSPASTTTTLQERELASYGSGDQKVGFGWLGRLPKPKLEGNKATYVDARPGVDLVVKATRTGFEQFLIVKNRSAVAQASTMTIPIDTTGLNVAAQQDGSIQLLDKTSGRLVVKIPSPVMWDAAVDPASQEHLNRAPVTMQLRGQGADTELVFTPDAAFLANTSTQYPVTIDPVVGTVTTTYDTYVQNNENWDASGSEDLKLGSYNGSVKARSYLTIPGGQFNGKQIIDAKLHLFNYHSSYCTPKQWEVWNAGGAAWWTRWGNEPQWGQMWTRTYETYDVDGGDSHQCTAPDGSAWTNTDVTDMIRYFAQHNSADYGLLLKATDENSNLSWKRFGSAESDVPPYISITYNAVPSAPSGIEVLPSQPGEPRYTNSATPRFQVRADDPDDGTVGVNVDLWRNGSFVNSIYRQVPANTYLQVGPADLGVAKLDEGVPYSVWTKVSDANSSSGWSGTSFVVDTTAPGTPTVTSADYPSDGTWHGAANQAGSFTFTPPAGTNDLAAYVYTLDGTTPVTVNATAGLTTSITPATDGRRVLKVQAKDRAGNLSQAAEYVFQVGQAGISSPVNGTQAAKRVKLSVDAQAQYKRVVYEYRRGPGATEYTVPRVNLTKADNTPVTEDKPLLADLGPHANWNVLDTLGNVGGVVQVRAKLFPQDGSGNGYTTVWNTLTVDRNADGAASADAGPGSVNLLTGDYSTSATDTSAFGMSVTRTSSSRGTDRGWQPQGERLTTNQRQIGTDTAGFTAGPADISRSTARGHDSSTDSLLVKPNGNQSSYVEIGTGYNLGQGMKPGRTYRLTGWIYVPGTTGLNPDRADIGLRLVGVHRTPAGYTDVPSPKASFTDGWQQLTVDMTVPKDATEAWFRLINGFAAPDKEVFFDDLSLKEIVAPFGPQWAGGPDAGAGSDFRSLSFPQSDLVEIKGNDDGTLTFAKGTDGTFFPEPGAESLTLKAVAATSGALLLNSSGQCLEVPNGAAGNGAHLQATTCTGGANQQWTRGDDQTLRLLGYCLDNPWGQVDNGTQLVLWGCNGGDNQKWDVRTDGQIISLHSGKCLDTDHGASVWVCWAGPNQVWDVQTNATTYELTELDGTKTVFARQAGSNSYQVVSEIGPGAPSATRYLYDTTDGRSLVKRVIPPVEAGVDDANKCSVEPLPRGCEVMEYEYAKSTTANATSPGDYLDRVKAVKVWSWNPATSKEEAVEVAHYAYDDKGRLAETWDPRLTQPLKTTYGYDDAGRVTRATPAGQLPWNFDFGKAAADQDPGRLLKVRRQALTQGSKNQVNGETAVNVVYDVPLTSGTAGGPYDLSGAEVAKWAQLDAPTDATAVFGPEDDPGTNTATAVKPGKDGYKPATVHYLNANGQEVNTATPSVTPGGDIDTKEYDRYGHVVRSLEATNRAIALGTHPDTGRYAAELNLPTDSAARARLLDTRTVYTADGQDVAETLGPVYRASLTEQVNGQSTPVTSTWEAEKLPQLGATAPVRVVNDNGALTWSGGAQLSLAGTQAGAYDVMRVSVPEEGEYVLSGQLTRFNDHGVIQFAIDGQNVGQPIDTFDANPAGSTAPYTAGQSVRLTRGDHELKVTVTGTNAGTQGDRYHAGLDTITLTKSTVNPTLAAGAPVVVRDHNTNTYDEQKPDGQAYHLVTTATDGARIDGYAADAEVRVTQNGYGTPLGGTSGWTLKKPTTVTTDALGAKLTTTTRYDAQGRTEEVRVPGSDTADASTVKSVYYTAGANAANAACANRPEWAGQPCVTAPGAAITGGDAARMPTTLPVKQVTRYSRTGRPEEVVETNAGKTRKTSTTYDAVDRTVSTEVTGDEGQAVPKAVTAYDPATGEAVSTTAGGKSITTVKDVLGRTISYTDADGATTTTEYDKFGKPVKVTDPTGVTTYTYDRAKEPRGLLTSVNDSKAGEFTAKYSPDGQLVEQTYPGGIVRKDTLNASGKAVARTYARTSDGKVVWAQNEELSTQGQVTKDSSTNGIKSYAYDRLGRLIKAEQSTVAAGCTTRTYTYDVHYNRTAKSTTGPAADGTCTTTGATTVNSTYDSADRITTAGYTYDAFGRTLTTPSGTALGYRVNDLVASQETATTKQTWTLDPAGRLNGSTTATKQADGTWSTTATRLNHYSGTSDNPQWTVEDAAGAWTRNVPGTDGDLAATATNTGAIKLQLTNLFGSVVLVTDTALTTPVLLDADEYGTPATAQAATRYGWLGAKQRSAEAQDGIVLMGVRLYNPATGRFLSVDPVPGGSANAYAYPCDPIGQYDLDGRAWRWKPIIRTKVTVNPVKAVKLVGRKITEGAKIMGSTFVRTVAVAQTAAVDATMINVAPVLGYQCSGGLAFRVCRGGVGLHSRGGTTIGSSYFTSNNPDMVSQQRLAHERQHAQQWRTFGQLFPFLYFGSGVNPCGNIWERQANLQLGGYRCP